MEGTRSYRIGEFGVGTRVTFLDSPTNVRFPGKWFVRNDPYACVSCSFMFDEEYALEPGEEFVLDYRVVLGDGVWPAGAYNITSTAYTLTRERSSEVMVRNVAIVMNGVTGRMGTRQHLVRSVLAIREQGGVALPGGEVVVPEPILVGRNENKLRSLAEAHGIERWSTDLDESLADPEVEIYFDSQTTTLRTEALRAAVEAGKHVYCEKPTATSLGEALEIAQLARERGVKNGVVQDKLFLPGLLKLKRLVDGGFFGRILSVRGEFGYWVFDGEGRQAQRPSWNYRKEEGGGIILDMLCHWRYVLDNLFGEVASVSCFGATHVPERWDENNEPYDATADDAAYATFELAGGVVAHINSSWCVRVNRDELFELQVDGTQGSAVAGLRDCKTQHGENTPKAVWNPDLPDTHDFRSQWLGLPQDEDPDNAFKIQWEMYLRHVLAGGSFPYDLLEGAKGVQLAELGLRSWRERRWLEVPALEPSRMPEKETGHA